MRKFKVALTFSELGGKGKMSDQAGYIEQSRDEWAFETEEEGNAFMMAIQQACLLVKLLWRRRK